MFTCLFERMAAIVAAATECRRDASRETGWRVERVASLCVAEKWPASNEQTDNTSSHANWTEAGCGCGVGTLYAKVLVVLSMCFTPFRISFFCFLFSATLELGLKQITVSNRSGMKFALFHLFLWSANCQRRKTAAKNFGEDKCIGHKQNWARMECLWLLLHAHLPERIRYVRNTPAIPAKESLAQKLCLN